MDDIIQESEDFMRVLKNKHWNRGGMDAVKEIEHRGTHCATCDTPITPGNECCICGRSKIDDLNDAMSRLMDRMDSATDSPPTK